jgi:hypothetical protein
MEYNAVGIEGNDALVEADEHKVLKNPKAKHSLLEFIMARFARMLAIRPIIGSIISLGLLVGGFVVAHNKFPHTWVAEYMHYINIAIGAAMGLTVFKSATRSLTLGLVTLAVGALGSSLWKVHIALFYLPNNFYIWATIVGIVAVVYSALVIE